jgi:hypothetical protein
MEQMTQSDTTKDLGQLNPSQSEPMILQDKPKGLNFGKIHCFLRSHLTATSNL